MRTDLDFEDLSDGEFVVEEYKSKGVWFEGGALAHMHPAAPHSGRIYVTPYRQEFAPIAYFTASFHSWKPKRVALYAGTEGGVGSSVFGVLRAFTTNGMEIAHDGLKQMQPQVCAVRFEVVAPSSEIAWVEMQMFGFDAGGQAYDPDQAIDDLQFEGDLVRKPRFVPFTPEPPIYCRWWWIETHGGLTPGPPAPPWLTWFRPFTAAVELAETAQSVSPDLRSSVLEIAAKQSAFALAGMKKEIAPRG
jgi:hypothetical protein